MNTEFSELEKQVLISQEKKMIEEIKQHAQKIGDILYKYGLTDRDDLKHLNIYRMSMDKEVYCSLLTEYKKRPDVKRRMLNKWLDKMEGHVRDMEDIKNRI